MAALGSGDGAAPRTIEATQLEVAVLERDRPRRAFRRLNGQVLADLLAEGTEPPAADAKPVPEGGPPEPGTPVEGAPEAAAEGTSEGTAEDAGGSGDDKPDAGPDSSGTSPGTDH
nr:hypothetical protein GCM10025730_54380 [Promicromonospora thailandica]